MINTELIDIFDLIVPVETTIFNEEETMELYDTFTHIMEEFIRNNPTIITEPDFDEIFEENINDLIEAHFDSDIFYTEEAEDEIANIIDQVKTDFFKDFMPIRSYPSSIIFSPASNNNLNLVYFAYKYIFSSINDPIFGQINNTSVCSPSI